MNKPHAPLGCLVSAMLWGSSVCFKMAHWYAENVNVLAGTASIVVSVATFIYLIRKKKL
jgi:hypothetical protein